MAIQYQTRRLVQPKDLNSNNRLFGGRLLEWIDEECGIFAMLELGTTRVATKLMSQIDFKAPAGQGDVIEIGIAIARYGRTSITLRVEAFNRGANQTILEAIQEVYAAITVFSRDLR